MFMVINEKFFMQSLNYRSNIDIKFLIIIVLQNILPCVILPNTILYIMYL